jgi:hypothetical protein
MTAAMPPPTPVPALLGGKLLVSLAALLLAGTLLDGTGGVASVQEGGRCAADAPPGCAIREDVAGLAAPAARVQVQLAAARAQADAAPAAARARLDAALERRDGSGGGAPGGAQGHAQGYTDATMRTA